METDTLWDRIKQGILESANSAAEKAEYLGKIGRARLDIAGTRHAIHETFAELGGVVYTYLRDGKKAAVAQKEDVQTLIEKIGDLEGLLRDREAALGKIRDGNNGDEVPDGESSAR
jgi:hypothetical protein